MESLKQSREKISEQSARNWENQEGDWDSGPFVKRRDVGLEGAELFKRMKATMKEIVPFRSSLRKTAVAGEYACAGDVDTVE